jgi:hypothetical protein
VEPTCQPRTHLSASSSPAITPSLETAGVNPLLISH